MKQNNQNNGKGKNSITGKNNDDVKNGQASQNKKTAAKANEGSNRSGAGGSKNARNNSASTSTQGKRRGLYGRKRERSEKQLGEILKRFRVLNILCACIMGLSALMYFADFFNLDIDGEIQNQISGFGLIFIFFTGALNDSDNVLSLINKSNSNKIAFASVASGIAFIASLSLMVLFIYRAAKRKPLLSKSALLSSTAVCVILVIQVIACGSLASYVTDNYYSGCATCLAGTLSFLPLLMFVLLAIVQSCGGYWLYSKYGITTTLGEEL